MPSSLSNVLVHIVFSTKMRHPFLADRNLRLSIHRHLSAISTRLECPPITVGGVEDHVHILARQARTVALAEWVKELKRVSSLHAKSLSEDLVDFRWQEGYGAFSVSQQLSRMVQRYIDQQERHHKTAGFQHELRDLLNQHQIAYEEEYLWD